MRSRMAMIAAAVTVGLLVTGVAWAAQDAGSNVNVALADNQQVELPVDEAGIVVVSRANGQLQIVSVTPNAGYTAEVEVATGREVEADFRGNGARVQFNAELEDGVVRVRIRTEASASSGASSTTAVTSTTTPTSSTGSTSNEAGSGTAILSDGQVNQVQVADAGSVLLARSGNSLTIVSTEANAGWAVEVEVSTGREVEGDFRNGNRRVKFNFELEDGVVRVRIESENSSGTTATTNTTGPTSTTNTTGTTAGSALPVGTVTYNLDGAGTVTVVFANGLMSIGSITPAAGWTIENSEQSGDEIEVELTNGEDEAKLKVHNDDGQLQIEIERKS